MNIRSVNNKEQQLKDYVVDNDSDLIALTETWLKPDDELNRITVGDLCPKGYKFTHQPRTVQRGGGVGLLYKDTLDIKPQKVTKFLSFEHTEVIVRCTQCIRLVIIYRPPPSKENKLKVGMFLEEFQTFLEQELTKSGIPLIIGDFNFHMEDIKDYNTLHLKNIIESFDLIQHVEKPTHKSGHMLDLIITRSCDTDFIRNIEVGTATISDHCAVHFNLYMSKPPAEVKEIVYRKIKSIDRSQFNKDIKSSLTPWPTSSLTGMVKQYNKVLTEVLEMHAPLKKRQVIIRPEAPWYNQEILQAKRKRRKLERKWRHSKHEEDQQQYIEQCNTVSTLISDARTQYYNKAISDCGTDQKSMYKVMNKLLHRNKSTPLPCHMSAERLANEFADHFTHKIINIRKDLLLLQEDQDMTCPQNAPACSITLDEFEMATEEEISKLIKKSASKSCSLDPIPTVLLKECLTVLVPVITVIVNLSLSSATMPEDLKKAILSPLLKKSSLDWEILKNFRPVSNLSYISKIIERVIAARLVHHMLTSQLSDIFQSAYKQYHSTETALIRVQNDILQTIDQNGAVLLVLLDLSAAFDTVDHQKLLSVLSKQVGIKGKTLQWFESYLQGRTQTVCIKQSFSNSHKLNCGVPQGSVLGPLLFTIYTLPLADIIKKHGLSYHLYADDTQLYLPFNPQHQGNIDRAKTIMEACIRDIRNWMTTQMLKLNDDKTEVLVITSKHRQKCFFPSLKVGNIDVKTSKMARNIGVIFDDEVLLEQHVKNITQQAFYHIRNIAKIRKFLTVESTKSVVHALITSKLDYCNSLLYGLPKYLVKKVQMIQNTAARLVCCCQRYEHITPVLKHLHWLPVEKRIEYKILLITFKALKGVAPLYIVHLLHLKESNIFLRSLGGNLLKVPVTKHVTYGDRSFQKVAPVLWNSLPRYLRTINDVNVFKCKLKAHLFKQVFT